MAEEENLKKIELKVSVDCCDGCKKKVLKALSIKGVLKMEIHPVLPKLTIIGNVDAQTLIKKLAKIGKMAELLPAETKKQETGEKKLGIANNEVNIARTDGKGKQNEGNSAKKSGHDQERTSNKSNQEKPLPKTEDSTKVMQGNAIHIEITKGAYPRDTMNTTAFAAAKNPQLNCYENPGMVQPPHTQISYAMGSSNMVPMACYMPSTYPAPLYCHCRHDMPVNQAVQTLPPRVADYFDDDNTVGCHVM